VLRDGDGMAAVFTSLGALLAAVTGCGGAQPVRSCFVVCNEILPRWAWRRCSSTATTCRSGEERAVVPTQAVFCETPSNPMQSLVDIAAISDLAHAAGAKVGVGQRVCHPQSCRRAFLWALTWWLYSGTKHIDGQGPRARGCHPSATRPTSTNRYRS